MKGVFTKNPLSSSESFQVSGYSPSVNTEFTRAANTDDYAAGDVVGDNDVIEFPNIGSDENGTGYITKVILGTTQSDNAAAYKLHFFSVAPTPIDDNEPFVLPYEDMPNFIGTVQLEAMTPKGSEMAYSVNKDIRLQYQCVLNTSLFGVLETDDVFSPATVQKYTITLGIEQN